MKDWTEVIKDRLLNDRSAVPEGELEVIERLIRSRRRRRVLVWSSIPFVFAASLALFLIFKNSGNIQTIEVKTPPEEERLWVETLSEPDRDLAPEHISKKKGEPLKRLMLNEPNFLRWMLKGDFDTEVKIIGVIDHFEIWAPLGYAKYQLAYDRDYEKLAKGN